MITIKVPATSANLGPGFDSIGVALKLYATFKVKEGTEFSIRGCPVAFSNEHNLFHRAYLHRVAQLKLKPLFLDIEVQSDIPVARGLGSSASFIVAGILCAHLIHDVDFTLEEIAWVASAFEGHPDNACPACLGGLRASLIGKDRVITETFSIHKDLRFYFVIPDFELLTSLTRLALPDKVAMKDVVHNLARLPLLLNALETGNQDQINLCIQDKLHHPYRFPLIYQSDEVLAILDKAGIKSTYISGAGPTIGFIHKGPINADPIQLELNTLRHKFKLIELTYEPQGIWYTKE